MSKFFIRRPIVAIVIAMITVIVGLVSLFTLPTAQYPNIVPPEIQTQATYAGADAHTLSQAVATPIEQQMNGVDNSLYMYSVNANNGQSTLYVDFDVKTDPNIDQVLTQLRVSQAAAQLPAQVNAAGLIVQKAQTSPLMIVSLSSSNPELKADFLTNYMIINLQDELTPHPRCLQDPGLRRPVRHPHLGQPRQTRPARRQRHRRHRRPPGPEQRQPRRSDRRRARPQGPAVHLHRPDQGPPRHARTVRQHRHPRQPRRLHPPSPRCRPR